MILRPDIGWIEVISGPMFAGKTRELIKRIEDLKWQRRTPIIFKPKRDFREPDKLSTHYGDSIDAVEVRHSLEIMKYQESIIVIDEAQMFDDDLPYVLSKLRDMGRWIIVSGLPLTSEGKPFGTMPHILAIADDITYIHGICSFCGRPATKTKALFEKTEDIVVGGEGRYTPRCNACWKLRG